MEHPGDHFYRRQERLPRESPLSLGSGGRANPRAVKRFLADADVILGVGCSFASTGFGVAMPAGKTIIHATLDPLDLNKDLAVQFALIGDAKLTLMALTQAMDKFNMSTAVDREDVPDRIAALRTAWLEEWAPKLSSDAAPINPYRVIAELNRVVDKERTIVTHDAGSPRDQMTPFWESTAPLSYIGWGKTTQLGYGLGLAMGAKLAKPDHLCINVWGDAAIGFTGMDLDRQHGSGFRSCRSCSTITPWPSRSPSCRCHRRSTGRPTFPAIMRTWPRRLAATASGSPIRATSSPPCGEASTPPNRASQPCWSL